MTYTSLFANRHRWSSNLAFCMLAIFALMEQMVFSMDLTSRVQNIGNPLLSRYPSGNARYARNVWDMQVYSGRIFIGSGNAANSGPAPNSGPVDLWSYNPATSSFNKEATFAQEQIGIFKVLGNKLYIPGMDPRNDPTGEFLYILNGGVYNTCFLPVTINHCFDLYSTSGLLLSALIPTDEWALRSSTDNGITWKNVVIRSPNASLPVVTCNLMRSFFTVNNKTLGSGIILLSDNTDLGLSSQIVTNSLLQIDGPTTATAIDNSVSSQMFPSLPPVTNFYVERPINHNGELVCIAAKVINAIQLDPLGLYVVHDIGQGRRIQLTDNAVAWDTLEGSDGRCYVLGNIAGSGGQYTVTVSSSADLVNWREDFRFQAGTFTRSFEYLNGKFYFGLGCDHITLSDLTGNILAIDFPINSSPTDIILTGTTIAENSPQDTLVGTLSTVDPDTSETFSYQFASPAGDGGGRFKLVGDKLVVADGQMLDYESATSHQVTLRVTDHGGLTLDKTFTINVTNVNEPSNDVILSDFTVAEGSLDDTLVGSLSAVDPDRNETFFFQFTKPYGDAGGRFKLVGNQLKVANGSLLDYEVADYHQVTIQAIDHGGLTFDKTFKINVINVNEPPVLSLDTSTSNSVYTENGVPTAIVPSNIMLSDPEGDQISSMTIKLLNPKDGDKEGLVTSNTSQISVIPYNPFSRTIQFAGSASAMDYQNIIRSTFYFNHQHNPDLANRQVEVTISDGKLTSKPALLNICMRPQPFMIVWDADTLTTLSSGTGGLDLGSVEQGQGPLVRKFLIKNIGGCQLNITNIQLPTGFNLLQGVSAVVDPVVGEYSFFLELLDNPSGVYAGVVSITTNQIGLENYSFNISARVSPKSIKSNVMQWFMYQ